MDGFLMKSIIFIVKISDLVNMKFQDFKTCFMINKLSFVDLKWSPEIKNSNGKKLNLEKIKRIL